MDGPVIDGIATTIDAFHRGRFHLVQPAKGAHRSGIDAMILAASVPPDFSGMLADLGAGAWTRFRRVTLPLTIEGIASGCTLVFLISTGFYATPVLLGGPSTTVFAETIAGFFHVAGDQWPTGAAFATIMFLGALLITVTFQKIMNSLRKGDVR